MTPTNIERPEEEYLGKGPVQSGDRWSGKIWRGYGGQKERYGAGEEARGGG